MRNATKSTRTSNTTIKEKAKTYAIIMLGAYIVGTKIIVSNPLGIISKIVLIILSLAMGVVSITENNPEDGVDLYTLAHLSAMMVGFFLAA